MKQGLVYGISLVNQNHLKTFSIMNTGNLGLDFECVWMTLKPEVIAKHNLGHDMQVFVDSREAMSELQRNRVILRDFSMDDLIPFEPGAIALIVSYLIL